MDVKHSQRLDLAVHALWHMAYEAPEVPVMIRDIAKMQGISESYLAKIFQNLAKTDIVSSVRGKNGGYRLGRPAGAISIGDVVRALNHDVRDYDLNCRSRGCTLTSKECFLPAVFEEARQRMYSTLDAVTLEDLVTQLKHREVPVAWVAER